MDQIIAQDIKEIVKRLGRTLDLLEGRTLLISGGAGFLGRYIVGVVSYLNKYKFKKPCILICVDNYITSDREHTKRSNSIFYLNHDVSRPLHIRRKLDYIIHAAGIASPIYYKKYPLQAIEVNTQGTKNLLQLALKNKVKSFLYFSSSEIYGNPDPKHIPTAETYKGYVSSIGPRACYDESKRLGEALVVNYYDVYKLPVKIVRPFNVYGPGMKKNDYRVVPAFLTEAIEGKSLKVHDTGKQTRTYCYISDAVVAFYKVLLRGRAREVYNVGNDKPEITTYKLAKIVTQLFDRKISIKLIPYPKSYPQDVPQRRCPDLTKIHKQLKYTPRIDLETGLQRTRTWFESNYRFKHV